MSQLVKARIAVNHQHELDYPERACRHDDHHKEHVKYAASGGLCLNGPASSGAAQRPGQRVEQLADRLKEAVKHLVDMRLADYGQHRTGLVYCGLALCNAEFLGPRGQRFPEQHVNQQHDCHHRHDGPADCREVLLGRRLRHKTADTGQCIRVIVD